MYLATSNTTKQRPPKLPWEDIKREIVGNYYELSLVFIGDKRSQTLNRTHRKLDKPASVLAFPLESKAGEIYLNLPYAKRRARTFDISQKDSVGYLFIHALLHLKGHTHGGTMDKREQEFCQLFGIEYPYRSQ